MKRLKKSLLGYMSLVLIFSLTLVGCGQKTPNPTASTTPVKEISAKDLLTAVKTIDFPGKGGHGDVVAYDPDKKAIYVAHTPGNDLIIINAGTQAIEKIIPNMNGVCGIAIGPKYIYVADGADNKLGVIEKNTWSVVANVDTGGKAPDAVYYDGINKKVFVGNVDTNNMSVISPDKPFKLVTSFNLSTDKPKAGEDLGVLISSKNRLYQSIDNYIVVIDTASNKILNKITEDVSIGKTGGLKDMIYDYNKNIIWVGTTSKKVFALNLDTNKTTKVVTQNGMDQITWDPAINMLFLGEKSATSGALEVINMATQKSIGSVKTETGFHTLDVDTNNHMVYAYYNTSNKIVIYKENIDLVKK